MHPGSGRVNELGELRVRTAAILDELSVVYPATPTPLRHIDGFQLLVATILSAQTTDQQVNLVTPALFARFPDVQRLAMADPAEVQSLIRTVGLFRTKARNIVACAQELLAGFDGNLPRSIEGLVSLPGVGRKTANVVAGHYLGEPAIIVDTHFGRVVRRLGLTESLDPERVERELRDLVPPPVQTRFSGVVNRHGRATCVARRPHCPACRISSLCPLPEKTEPV